MLKEILEGNVNELSAKFKSRKGFNEPTAFTYEDNNYFGIIKYNEGHFEAYFDDKTNNKRDFIYNDYLENYKELENLFKKNNITIPKTFKEQIKKSIITYLKL